MRLAALPGVLAITSARPPDDFAFRTAAVSLKPDKSGSPIVQSLLYYTYVQPNYFQTLGIPLVLGPWFSTAGRPTRALRNSQ